MPSRRKPTSTRQKKADQQLRRAIKRGDVPPPEVKKSTNTRRKQRIGPTGRPISGPSETGTSNAVQAARKLQSAFVKVSSDFLEETKTLASNLPLLRPIPNSKAIFQLADQDGFTTLISPKRPKWRYDQSKLEVERNEEGIFKKWLSQTDDAIEQWQSRPLQESSHMPHSSSHFERNLEVWRQLWRVTEISQIILVLLDSRCPILHFPPSLSAYLGDRKTILVLTKVDISGHARAHAWIKYFQEHHPNSRIVQVESYIEKDVVGDQGPKLYEPHLPASFRETLVNAIKEVHAELLEPPEEVKQHPERLKNWIPPVKREIDWESVLNPKDEKVGLSVGGAAVPRPKSPEDSQGDAQGENDGQHQEPTHLTVGLIGQPNVGKSSLLNALFGAHRVRASKTPGKTKHFQTLFWTSDVRLVDCPGLVMPNYVPMEMQVLAGTLPISRVSAVPACIFHAAELLPLENIFGLSHPGTESQPESDKRTWRDGTKSEQSKDSPTPPVWTAMDILTAYADKKGWVTAKAGRPDVHRAGNAILRALAEGRISWAFWPPGTPLEHIAGVAGSEGHGIWIPHGDNAEHDGSESESDVEERQVAFDTEEEEIEISEDEFDEDDSDLVGNAHVVGLGRFGALSLSGNDADEEPEEE